MKIKILSDSTCDLPAQLVRQHDIGILPLSVIKDDEVFTDGITITPDEIFRHVAQGGSLCTTSACNYDTYREAFRKYSQDYDGVVCINLGSDFSSSYQNASLAAAEFDNVVTVDSKNLSTGQAQVVMEAVRLAETAEDLQAMKAQLEEFTGRVEISFLLDRLDYMVKGGRCSSATALGANLLHLRPCIEVKNGKMSVVKKYRGSYDKCLGAYARDRIQNRDDLDYSRMFFTWTVVDDKCYNAVRTVIDDCGKFREVIESQAGCTISCHCGPGTLGLSFVRNK